MDNLFLQIKNLPRVNTRCKCLALIMVESISRVRGNENYPQTFMYDCEYNLNNNNLKNITRKKRANHNFEKSSFDESDKPESETYRESDESEEYSKKSNKSS